MSDAIDIDFGSGKLSNLTFNNIQNDAIDVSGSVIDINGVKANNCGDKIISVGEKSKIKITNLIGDNSFIGIENKDASITEAKNITLNSVKIGFASYIKNEYLSYLDVKNYKFNKESLFKDKNSRLDLDNQSKKFNNEIIKIIMVKN